MTASHVPDQQLQNLLDRLGDFAQQQQRLRTARLRVLVDRARRNPALAPLVQMQVQRTCVMMTQRQGYAHQALRLLRAYCTQPDRRLLVQAQQLVAELDR